MKRKAVTMISTLMILCLLTGCSTINFWPKRQELVLFTIVQLVTIDVTDDGNYRLGALYTSESTKAELSGTEKTDQLYISAEARTVAQAEEKLQNAIEKKLYWGHVDYVIIGERAAREDLSASIDYFVRGMRFGLNMLVYTTPGDASGLAERSSELPYSLHDFLDIYTVNSQQMSQSYKLELIDYIGPYLERYSAIPMPMVQIQDEDVLVEGYGIIKNYELVDYLRGSGYNYLNNYVEYDIIPVSDQKGQSVALQVLDSKTDIAINVQDGKLTDIHIHTKVQSSIDEVHNERLDTSQASLAYFEEEQSEYIYAQMNQAIMKSQEWNTDFLSLWKKVWISHPIVWEGIQEDWNEIYPQLPITITVESQIMRTYDIDDFGKEGVS